MTAARSNVVQLVPHGLSVQDAETIELMAHMLTGEGLRLRDMEVTSKTIEQLQAELGPPSSSSKAYIYPAHRWRWEYNGKRLTMLVIDQGSRRFFFYVPNR